MSDSIVPTQQGTNTANDIDEFGPNMYSDVDAWRAATAQWEAGGRSGPQPLLNSRGRANLQLGQSGFSTSVKNADLWQSLTRAGANAPARTNPYSAQVADQARAAQMALVQQMRAQMNGPSLAAMQGQRALGQSGQQALAAAAMGAPNRAAMLNAQGIGGGLAGDVGQARLAEVMRAQGGMGGALGALRGADLRSAEAQSQAALQMRGMDDAARRFYAAQGVGLANTMSRQELEAYKLREMIRVAGKASDLDKAKMAAGGVASTFSGLV